MSNDDSIDDEIEPGMTAINPQWWISSAMVAAVVAMYELKTIVTSWKCDNELGSQHWTSSWSQDHEEYRARKPWNQASSKPYMDHYVGVWSLVQSFQWEPLWVHYNQNLITYCDVLQPLVRLCSRLTVIIVDCHLPRIMIMQLMQMWCRRLNCNNKWD